MVIPVSAATLVYQGLVATAAFLVLVVTQAIPVSAVTPVTKVLKEYKEYREYKAYQGILVYLVIPV